MPYNNSKTLITGGRLNTSHLPVMSVLVVPQKTLRQQVQERPFAEAKVNHGLRYARMPGIRKMREL